MRGFLTATAALAMLVLLPAAAHAQASVTGVVKDSSGAVLPGVTVEASSPVLIEKVRTAVSDGTGQYRIVDLRPGTYTVTFTLAGFGTVKREGIELTGSFTASVNADLKVGTVAETITVTGEAPVVDVQSAKRQQTLSGDVINAIPAVRGYNAHEGRVQVDGVNVGAAVNGGGVSGYITDIGNAQEVTFTTSGGLGEAELGGPLVNIVPRTGGNTVKGSFYTSVATDALQGSNYTQELKAAGLSVPAVLLKLWDVNGSVGGPIRQDRLWYFANARAVGSASSVPGMFANLNAGNAAAWTYVPDVTRQARNDTGRMIESLRLTWQITPRNKLNLFLGRATAVFGIVLDAGYRRVSKAGGRMDPGRQRDEFARVGDLHGKPAPRATVHLHLAGDQPGPGGVRLWHVPQSVGRQSAAGQSDTRSRTSDGTSRKHPGPHVPIAELGEQLARRPYLAGVGLVCHRRP
jgi:hypothetical protein